MASLSKPSEIAGFLLTSAFPLAGLVYLIASVVGKPEQNVTGSGKASFGEGEKEGGASPLLIVMKSKIAASISITRVTFSAADGIFNTLFSIYAADELGIPLPFIGFMFTLRGLMNSLARIPAGRLSHRTVRKLPLLASYISSIAAYAIFSEGRDLSLPLIVMAMEWDLPRDVIRGALQEWPSHLSPSCSKPEKGQGLSFRRG
ncbi:MAG: hypothetical protein QW486_09255 [Candidatus Bathyarchaeia archaeon]|nr:hypothetical protein [Candidatus Bathyarchaeota archaeon]